jgi:hypothetical protein
MRPYQHCIARPFYILLYAWSARIRARAVLVNMYRMASNSFGTLVDFRAFRGSAAPCSGAVPHLRQTLGPVTDVINVLAQSSVVWQTSGMYPNLGERFESANLAKFCRLLGVESFCWNLRVALNLWRPAISLRIGLYPVVQSLHKEAPEAVLPVVFVHC